MECVLNERGQNSGFQAVETKTEITVRNCASMGK
jgi:hypothetical protein